MVHLTADYIVRYNGHTKKQRDEPTNHYLKRITHLYMAERCIESIDNLSACRNLTVLYLYDNKLNHTINLGTAQNLTHLYLQNNNISKIEGLGHLSKLIKLYIGYNNILVVEGLQNLHQLTELHVENQRIPTGEKVLFDPRSLVTLAKCLCVLNVSGNNLDTLSELSSLKQLTNVTASDNELNDFGDINQALSAWRQISKVELSGNPLCHKAKYRDRIILMSRSLDNLDGKVIKPMERKFLLSWQASRELRKKQSSFVSMGRLLSAPDNMLDLPPLQQPIHPIAPPPHYTMGGLPGGRKRFEAILAKSRSLPVSAAHGSDNKRPVQHSSPAIRPLPEHNEEANKSVSKKSNRQMTPHPNNKRWTGQRSRTFVQPSMTQNNGISRSSDSKENPGNYSLNSISNYSDGRSDHNETNHRLPFQFRSSSRQPLLHKNSGIHPMTNNSLSNGLDSKTINVNGKLSNGVDNNFENEVRKMGKNGNNNIGDNLLERGTLVPLPSPRMDGEGNLPTE